MRTAERIDAVQAVTRRVRRTLDESSAALTGRRVLALCSGGADSVALVAVLSRLPRGAAPRSTDVLFLDHGLRDDIVAERHAARAAAAIAGMAFHERRADADLALGVGGIEAAARTWRYHVAEVVAHELGCDVIATGHSADDQLESALLSLAGVTGRAGDADAMPMIRELPDGARLVRPLLAISRQEIEAACASAGLEWARDPSNEDAGAFRRNAIRRRVVPPLLDAHPGAGSSLLRAGARARAASDVTRSLADALIDAWGEDGDAIDVRRIAGLPTAARREVLARWLARAPVGRDRTSRIIVAVDRLATLPGRAACAVVELRRGACVRRDGYHLRIQHAPDTEGSRP